MNRTISIAALALLAVAGCKSQPASNQSANNVLTPGPAGPVAPVTPVADNSTAIDTSTPTPTPTPMTDIATGESTGGKYTVRHGDTLYRIALSHYGDGKQWKKIALANPGVEPTKLKVGQTLVLP